MSLYSQTSNLIAKYLIGETETLLVPKDKSSSCYM